MSLTESERRILRAAVDRLVPADEFPGAWEAGVGDYVERQLAGDLAPLAVSFAGALRAVDAEATLREGRGFVDLTADEQDALLRRIETGDALAEWPAPTAELFALLVNVTAEGYYSDPGNGGNRGAVSWDMVGFREPTEP